MRRVIWPPRRVLASKCLHNNSFMIFLWYDSGNRRTRRRHPSRRPQREGLDPGPARRRAGNKPKRRRPDGAGQAEPQPQDDPAARNDFRPQHRQGGQTPDDAPADRRRPHPVRRRGRQQQQKRRSGAPVRQPDQPRHHGAAPPCPDRRGQPDRGGPDQHRRRMHLAQRHRPPAPPPGRPGPGRHGRGGGAPHPQRDHAPWPAPG